jgi:hypothetical protein
MKKIIVGLTLLLSLASFTAFARGEEKVSQETLLNFKKEFKAAENVSWAVADEIATASFSMNGFRIQAYFDGDGQLLGTARTILFEQLPITVINSINNRFETAPVYGIVEYTRGAETFYCMTVETTKNKFNVRATSSGNISVDKKIKKQ